MERKDKVTARRSDIIKLLVESGEYSPAMADAAISHYMQERIGEGMATDQAWNATVEFMTLTIGEM